MDIYILNGFNVVGLVQSFKSVVWNTQFFGYSDLVLEVPGTTDNLNTLTEGKMLVREEDRTSTGFNNVMIIESRELRYDVDEGWILTIRGEGLKSILKRRVIWNQANYSGSVERAIRQAVTDNAISPTLSARAITSLTLGSYNGFTDTFDCQLCGENLGYWIVDTGTAYGIGWDIVINNNTYVFKLMKGTDRTFNQSVVDPVVFSPEYDNLISVRLTKDKSEYKNAGLVLGEGEGVDQRTATVGTASGLNRYETQIDGKSVSSNGEIITLAKYLQMLADYGNEQLANTGYTQKIEAEVIPNGMFKLNQDYYLGDIVQLELNGITAHSRILEIIYSEDGSGYQLVPTFGEWEV